LTRQALELAGPALRRLYELAGIDTNALLPAHILSVLVGIVFDLVFNGHLLSRALIGELFGGAAGDPLAEAAWCARTPSTRCKITRTGASHSHGSAMVYSLAAAN
jgi:hypothetical protein